MSDEDMEDTDLMNEITAESQQWLRQQASSGSADAQQCNGDANETRHGGSADAKPQRCEHGQTRAHWYSGERMRVPCPGPVGGGDEAAPPDGPGQPGKNEGEHAGLAGREAATSPSTPDGGEMRCERCGMSHDGPPLDTWVCLAVIYRNGYREVWLDGRRVHRCSLWYRTKRRLWVGS